VTDSRTSLSGHYRQVLEQIQQSATGAGRQPGDVRLIAVSKTRSLDEVKALVSLGQRDFGENTLQDAMTKIPAFQDAAIPEEPEIEWHFIGHLQKNKANKVAGNFQWLHTVDELRLADKLSAAIRRNAQAPLNCLLQVNVSGEQSKSGLSPDEVLPFIDELLELELAGLRWRGLMTIGVRGNDAETHRAFAELRKLADRIRQHTGLAEFDQLSMGMSDDYRAAIEEGATMVRVGSSIFGPRSYPSP
jgi:pyridoxal phosphate enzyme (YggS family)